ncbi:hypothetical protein NUH86_08655 [Sphingobium sp. JS3065]|uniref:hypothetical protein n=1 Tax=Sphingobium sp. JS3065 TaxID=2970925 RepID=UPI0022651789|nr:hypothetical protein [Sphingobium sp. JS3065]UZW53638.1 hypothetical protein NUH86_08655 [Sphingobium sp. JS3065]
MSEASAIKWAQRYERVGDRRCAGTGGHRPSKVKPERDWLLAAIATEPDITLSALSAKLLVERGVRADTSMLSRFFIGEGISFKKTGPGLSPPVWGRNGPCSRWARRVAADRLLEA